MPRGTPTQTEIHVGVYKIPKTLNPTIVPNNNISHMTQAISTYDGRTNYNPKIIHLGI